MWNIYIIQVLIVVALLGHVRNSALGTCTCAQPKVSGNCDDGTTRSSERYFYNTKLGKCDKFEYSGCGGNEHNFETELQCEEECAAQQHCECSDRKYSGPCMAAIPRYFYNTAAGLCEQFVFGGCFENRNNFETMEDCSEFCTV